MLLALAGMVASCSAREAPEHLTRGHDRGHADVATSNHFKKAPLQWDTLGNHPPSLEALIYKEKIVAIKRDSMVRGGRSW